MVKTFKVYLPFAIILSLCVFGLLAPVIYNDIYGEIITNSPTFLIPLVQEATSVELCNDPTKLLYNACGMEDLASIA